MGFDGQRPSLFFFPLGSKVHLCRCVIVKSLVRSSVIVELKVLLQSRPNFLHVLISFRINLLILHASPKPFNKHGVKSSSLPSMLSLIPLSSSLPVNWLLVNWTPWSVLKISGICWQRLLFKASMQNSIPSRFESSHLITYRQYQSMIANKYPNPLVRGM